MINKDNLTLLEKVIDGEASEYEILRLDRALAGSSELRTRKAELLSIRSIVRPEVGELPPELERKIENSVRFKYAEKPQVSERFALRSKALGIVSFAILVISITAISINSVEEPSQLPETRNSENEIGEILNNIRFAQIQYELAIDDLEDLATSRLSSLPTAVSLIYLENLEIVENEISLIESIQAEQPNSLIFNEISFLYETKIDLLVSILTI